MAKIGYDAWRDYLEEQVANGSIYLWGGQGQDLAQLTDAFIRKMETSAANARRVIRLRDEREKEYPNLRAYDCSGLAIYYLYNVEGIVSGDMTANTIMSKCTTLSKARLEPGDFVFRIYTSGSKKGRAYHVGFVVDDGYVIEAKGRDDGVVKRTMNASGSSYWNAFGRSPWIETGDAEEDGDEAYVFTRELKKGSQGEDVRQLQLLLKKAGMNPGTIDGIFGANTVKAVKLFQKANALKADGIAGKATIQALGGIWQASPEAGWTVSRLLKKTSPLMTGNDVKNLQKALIARGYNVGSAGADGEYGSGTEAAVKKFQKAEGLTADGIAGEKTVEALGGTWKGSSAPSAWTVSRLLKKTSPLMTGDDVKNLQKALIAKGYSVGSAGADGEYGSGTEAAVKKFQKAEGLTADGIAGEKTVEALGGTWKENSAPSAWTVSRLLKKTSPLMTGDDVKNLQKALIAKGYSVGSAGADGEYGSGTEAAVKKFQKAEGLTADGIAGEKTVEALGGTWKGSSAPSAWTVSRLLKKTSPLMTGDDVKNLQKALIAKGYSVGSAGADGEYGSGTEAAVKKFQKAEGLTADGIAGEKTVEALGGTWKG